MKNILIVGASGLIGKHLIQLCLSLKWSITTFSYSNKKTAYPINQLPWNPKFIISDENINLELVNAMNEADVVINMAGSTVAKGRLGKKVKDSVLQSRIEATSALVRLFNQVENKDKVWIQMSGSSFYGSQADNEITETTTSAGNLFLADVSKAWEGAVDPIRDQVNRLIILRMGLVIAKDSPAFQRIILPILLFSGGPLASGKQYWPWVHVDDVVHGMAYLIEHDSANGIFNIGSPNPETQLNFTKIVGKAYKRPVLFPNLPAWFLRLVAGNAINELVMPSQRMLPKHLLDIGYKFKYPNLKKALEKIRE